jgi:hypothetical protein
MRIQSAIEQAGIGILENDSAGGMGNRSAF